ncbi:MAG: glutamate--tRNA ligase family protein [Vicinamibacterales bacterium]
MSLTRFAPSPTGYLHLGHVVNAIYVWGTARRAGARVLLRIEDHDRIRSRPEYERAILEDLDWLGFEADEGRSPVLRQSDRHAVYEQALSRLRRTHHVYACDCSRKEARLRHTQVSLQPHPLEARVEEGRYDGHCRDRGLAETPGRSLRVRIEPGVESFQDLCLGPVSQSPADQCGDLLLRDRHGHWTYQFAATADDAEQGVDLIIRGNDLLESTGRQLRLAHMLGRSGMPKFLHHPLLMAASGRKLSKSEGDASLRELRAAGVSPASVIGRAAVAGALAPDPRPVFARDVAGLF